MAWSRRKMRKRRRRERRCETRRLIRRSNAAILEAMRSGYIFHAYGEPMSFSRVMFTPHQHEIDALIKRSSYGGRKGRSADRKMRRKFGESGEINET